MNSAGFICPNSYLGILGGGQLGRMFVKAAQTMGYKVCVFDPNQDSPAGSIAEKHIKSSYTDELGLFEMANTCKVITIEFENIPIIALNKLKEFKTNLVPKVQCISILQNRISEKNFLYTCGKKFDLFPVSYFIIQNDADLKKIKNDFFPSVLKTATMGYDGKGQKIVHNKEELLLAWNNFQNVTCVLEKFIDIDYEVSIIVVRGYDNQIVLYPISQNVHYNGLLYTTIAPSPSITSQQSKIIQNAGIEIIQNLEYVGVLCIEFFILKNGSIILNEIAPRPHNSGHYTQDACITSQFEQQVRAMIGAPLGSSFQYFHSMMINLLGNEWYRDNQKNKEPNWLNILQLPYIKLHLYGKSQPKKNRKMGHLNLLGNNIKELKEMYFTVSDILK